MIGKNGEPGEGILVKEIQPPVAASTNAGAHVFQNLDFDQQVESWAARTRDFDFDQESWGSFNDVDSQFEPPVMDDAVDGIESDDDSEYSYKTMHSSKHSSIENSPIPDPYAHLPAKVRREVEKYPYMLEMW